jgi:hypothetical protein
MDMKPRGPDSFDGATSQCRVWLGTRVTITDDAWAKRGKILAKAPETAQPGTYPTGPCCSK